MNRTRKIISKSLIGLKEILNNNNQMKVLGEEGTVLDVKCTFNDPSNTEELKQYEESTGLLLPDDYHEFLLIHNGAIIFELLLNGSLNIGGGLYLFSIEEVKSTKEKLAFEQNHYPIARLLEGHHLVVDVERIKNNDSNYLLIINPFFNETTILNLNFELFLDRYLLSQGSSFWNWSVDTAENYYRTHSDNI
ncbi:SMI1/KNR4 family protein [Bacillus spongiae]|uniref:SMI1/KNR4 family protein n=1 Tax=Bacillus spongiae TaxID=2683610 RepID=A0ABU8HFI4_9BACI